MAIKSKRNYKTILGAADLTLTAKTGESLLVTDVRVFEPTAVYVNFLIERTSVGFFRVGSLLGSHLHFLPGRNAHAHNMTMGSTAIAVTGNGALAENAGGTELANIRISESAANDVIVRPMNVSEVPSSGQSSMLAHLKNLGIFSGYPIAEGETFTLELATAATAVKVVEYEIHDVGDMLNTMNNGSKSDTLFYMSYGDSGANIQAEADNVLGESNNPAEYPDFPYGAVVPAGHKIELIGICASDVSPAANAAANCTQTEYLKFMQGREVLFDEDHNGLLFYSPFPDALANMNMIAEGYSIGGNFTQCDVKEPHMFDPPIIFLEGEELTVSWHVIIAGAGAAISQQLQEIALILRLSPLT
ncbi:MAG TPA: hypothetical protein ENH82_10850 [bacterium]|nr:hypothetical protein [bacterium]